MKLASLKSGGRDGTLIVVNRALTRAVACPQIAATMQAALDDWHNAAPRLNALAERLELAENAQTIDAQEVFSLDLHALVTSAAPAFGEKITDASSVLVDFIYDRLAGSLREQGYSAQEVDAVISLRPKNLGEVPKRLVAVRGFVALPEASALAAANKRISNILKKTQEVDPHVSEVLLKEPAEIALYAAMKDVAPKATAQFEAGDYTASLQTLAVLRAPVDAFFEGVMVNAEALDLRLNRLGLLASLHQAMNRVADLSKLAS